jgi:hypothetical protein
MATTITKLFPTGILQSSVEFDEIALQDVPPVTGLHYLITFYNNNFRLNFIEQSSWVNFTAQMNIGDAVYATHGSSGRLYYGVITAFDNSAGGPGPNPNVTNPLGHPDFFGTYDGQPTYFEVGGLTNFTGVRVSPTGVYAKEFDEVTLPTVVGSPAERRTSTGTYLVSGYFDEYSMTVGQQEFTTPGIYSWTAPEGVTNVSVVAVGGGGGGSIGGFSGTGYATSGGGGGLGWKNNITVVQGQTYTVVVGVAGDRGVNPSNQPGSDGGDSYFISAGTVLGGKGFASGTGGTYIGDGGGNGGLGRGGGGGAGGYSGNGGNGETYWNFPTSSNDATDGSGGGGGGGTCSAGMDPSSNGQAGGGGGGVGIRGQGASGLKGQPAGQVHSSSPGGDVQPWRGGGGGSGGTNAIGTSNSGSTKSGNAGQYGGGGGGWGTGYSSNTLSGKGGSGAVRIIWGAGRAFPSTNTNDV